MNFDTGKQECEVLHAESVELKLFTIHTAVQYVPEVKANKFSGPKYANTRRILGVMDFWQRLSMADRNGICDARLFFRIQR